MKHPVNPGPYVALEREHKGLQASHRGKFITRREVVTDDNMSLFCTTDYE